MALVNIIQEKLFSKKSRRELKIRQCLRLFTQQTENFWPFIYTTYLLNEDYEGEIITFKMGFSCIFTNFQLKPRPLLDLSRYK